MLAATAGRESDPSRDAGLIAHLDTCQACARELSEYKDVIHAARSAFAEPGALPEAARRRIAAQAAEERSRGSFRLFWMENPLRPAFAGATLAAAMLLVGVFVGGRGEAPTAGGSPLQLEMHVESDGKVRLAWQDGQRAVYTVRKSTDPRGFANAETHVVKGNTWVDEAPATSQVVFYQVN